MYNSDQQQVTHIKQISYMSQYGMSFIVLLIFTPATHPD